MRVGYRHLKRLLVVNKKVVEISMREWIHYVDQWNAGVDAGRFKIDGAERNGPRVNIVNAGFKVVPVLVGLE